MKRIAICLVLVLLVSAHARAQLPERGAIGLYADEYHYNTCLNGTGILTFYCFVLPSVTGMQCVELSTELSSQNIWVLSVDYNPDCTEPVLGGVPGDLSLCFNSCHSTDWVMAFSATLFVEVETPQSITLGPYSGNPYMIIQDCEEVDTQADLATNLYINDPGCLPPPPPPYLSYVTVQDGSHIIAGFTQCLHQTRAENPDQYILFPKDDPTDTIQVVSAEMDQYCYDVFLTLEGSLTQYVTYTLIAEDMLRSDAMSSATSQLDFQGSLVAVMLQGFHAQSGPEGVELTWELAGVDGDISFEISRRTAAKETFEELSYLDVERVGDTYACVDIHIEPDESYIYRVEYTLGSETAVLFQTEAVETPAMPLSLEQNVPNPFNPMTEIRYYLPEAADVRLEVYDISGRLVDRLADGLQPKGWRTARWDGTDAGGRSVASGVYFYRLRAGKEIVTKKMVLLR